MEKRTLHKLFLFLVLSFWFLVFSPGKAHAAIAFRAASSVVVATGGSNATVTKPTGTVDGDLMIAVMTLDRGSSVTPALGTVPTGWTLLTSIANTSSTVRTLTAVYYKVAASEGASYVWGGASADISVGIMSYSGAARVNPIDGTPATASIGTSASTTTSFTVGSITTTQANSMVVAVAGAERTIAESFTAPTGTTPTFTERLDGGSTVQGIFVESSDGILASAGATGSKTITASGAAYGGALLFAIKANTAPTFSVQPSASYGSYTRTGPNNTPWSLGFTAADAQDTGAAGLTYTLKRSSDNATIGSVTGTFTSGAAQAINVAYNATNLAEGSNTLYVTASDGLLSTDSNTFTLLVDNTAPSSSTSISTTPSSVNTATGQYTVTFTPSDAISTGTNEIAYQIRTATGGGGTLLTSGTSTNNSAKTTGTITDTLTGGNNTRYVRTCDGANNCTDTSFTVTGVVPPTVSTLGQSNLTPISVELNGQTNPNGTATTGWFRYFTSNPSNCNSDSSGTRVPSSSGSDLGSGSQNVAYRQTVSTGLVPGTLYYVCAYSSNTAGTSGASNVISFTAPGSGTCSSVPQAGNYNLSTSCVFGGGTATYDGVDNGTGTTNNAQLNITSGQSLNVAPGQTIAYGVINKQGATIIKFRGAVLMKAPVWVPDSDQDAYPDNAGTTGQVVSFTKPAGYMRRNAANGLAADCAATDANIYRNIASLVQDGDTDYYSKGSAATQCVGASQDPVTGAISNIGSTTVQSGTSSNVTINKPTGTASGDTMIAAVCFYSASSSVSAPSGWTFINSGTGGSNFNCSTYYKIAGGSEGSNYTFTVSLTTAAVGMISTYRLSGATLVPYTSQKVTGSGGTTVAIPAVTTNHDNDKLIAVYLANFGNGTFTSYTSPLSQEGQASNVGSGTITMAMADGTQASAGSSGTMTGTYSTTLTAKVGILIALGNQIPSSTYYGLDGTSITQRGATNTCSNSASTGTTCVLNKPTGVTTNDMLVAFICADNTGKTINSAPSGWTAQGSAFGTATLPCYMYTKSATGAEPSSYTWTWNNSASTTPVTGLISAFYDPSGGTVTYDQGATSSDATATNHAITGITTTQNSELLVGMWGNDTATTSAYSNYTNGFSEIGDVGRSSLATSMATASATLAGSTGTASAFNPSGGAGSGMMASFYSTTGGKAYGYGYISGTNGTDCNDSNNTVYQNLTGYGPLDNDNDGYGALGPSGGVCSGDQLPTGYSASSDCYDLNANAHPGQTTYFGTNRGDGSFDYDCNGSQVYDPTFASDYVSTSGNFYYPAASCIPANLGFSPVDNTSCGMVPNDLFTTFACTATQGNCNSGPYEYTCSNSWGSGGTVNCR